MGRPHKKGRGLKKCRTNIIDFGNREEGRGSKMSKFCRCHIWKPPSHSNSTLGAGPRIASPPSAESPHSASLAPRCFHAGIFAVLNCRLCDPSLPLSCTLSRGWVYFCGVAGSKGSLTVVGSLIRVCVRVRYHFTFTADDPKFAQFASFTCQNCMHVGHWIS